MTLIKKAVASVYEWRKNRLINSQTGRFCDSRMKLMGYSLKRDECTHKQLVWIGENGKIILC